MQSSSGLVLSALIAPCCCALSVPYPMHSLDVQAFQLSVYRWTTPSLRYRSTSAATTLRVNSTKYLTVVLPRLVA